MVPPVSRKATSDLDVAVVGAGFAGLYALHRLRTAGFHTKVFEAAGGVGGTWYANRYPGARCDVQSQVYCYTFDERLQREWIWSERYPAQPEILRYLNFVADRLDLREDILLNSRIAKMSFDESAHRWELEGEDGEVTSAVYVILATGALSVGRIPNIPGTDQFEGIQCHTGDWPEAGVCFSKKRVAVIGTGSSGVQIIPVIAKEAERLTVFQRTPSFVAPARNAPLTEVERDLFASRFEDYKMKLKQGDIVGVGDVILSDHLPQTKPSPRDIPWDECQALLQGRWDVGGMAIGMAFSDIISDESSNDILANFFREKIKDTVSDSARAEMLIPRDYPIGSKRTCVGTDYYETFNRQNVSLVNAAEDPIEQVTPTGLRTRHHTYEFDIIVYATGFDAFTGAISGIDIIGCGGSTLREAWSEGPQTYLGIAVAGFPNLFTVTGPGSPSVLGNVVVCIEQHVEWIADFLEYARANMFDRIEAERQAQEQWSEHVSSAAAETLFVKGKSWYLGANVPGKARVFMAYVRGIGAYRRICDEVARNKYRGFRLSRPIDDMPYRAKRDQFPSDPTAGFQSNEKGDQ